MDKVDLMDLMDNVDMMDMMDKMDDGRRGHSPLCSLLSIRSTLPMAARTYAPFTNYSAFSSVSCSRTTESSMRLSLSVPGTTMPLRPVYWSEVEL